MNNNSTLSRKLFIRIAPMIIVIILLIGGLAFHSADKEINMVYDAQLITNANVLWVLVSDSLESAEDETPKKLGGINLKVASQLPVNDSAGEYADSRMFRVWQGGAIMMYSATSFPKTIPKQPDGFSTLTYNGEAWRVYALPIPSHDVYIEVAEKIKLRDALVTNILLQLALPLMLLIPVVGMLIWFGIRNGLGAIHYLVNQISSRSPDDLSSVDTATLPQDLYPLGHALNQLFTKLERSFESEKRFTNHAAHQLRTPQATIKLQLQMLAKATTEEEKETLMQELMVSNERASKLVQMLLTTARIHHQPITLRQMEAYPVIASVMAEFGVLAQQKEMEMSLEGEENACMLADEVLFRLMISNLIENAIKYTPAKGSVHVNVMAEDGACNITITDTGCGIPEEERSLVFGRFYRIATPEVEGTGLGLTIVAEIIERFSGSVTLHTPESEKGLRVEVRLPSHTL